MLLGGRLADLPGRKVTFLAGLASAAGGVFHEVAGDRLGQPRGDPVHGLLVLGGVVAISKTIT
jgi:hypothetical protein